MDPNYPEAMCYQECRNKKNPLVVYVDRCIDTVANYVEFDSCNQSRNYMNKYAEDLGPTKQ